MRKLLVASQKGGVGKTTTAINVAAATALAGARVLLVDADPLGSASAALNLARHPRRQPLREIGIDHNGSVCHDVVPGLDVISPYEDGGAADDDLLQLLKLLDTGYFRDRYRTVVLDTPPFMGVRPRHLLQACDEFLLVMRAEPMTFRLLPVFLETLKTIQRDDGDIWLRGILLTMPVTGRWEPDLRRYLGDKCLPQTIPYDQEVSQAVQQAQAVVSLLPDTPAAQQYRALVAHLDLTHDLPQRPPRPAPIPQKEIVPVKPAVVAPRVPAHHSMPEFDLGSNGKHPVPTTAEPQRDVAAWGPPADVPASPEPAWTAAGPTGTEAYPGSGSRRRRRRRPPQQQYLWVTIAIAVLCGAAFGSVVQVPEFFMPLAAGVATTAAMLVGLRVLVAPPAKRGSRSGVRQAHPHPLPQNGDAKAHWQEAPRERPQRSKPGSGNVPIRHGLDR